MVDRYRYRDHTPADHLEQWQRDVDDVMDKVALMEETRITSDKAFYTELEHRRRSSTVLFVAKLAFAGAFFLGITGGVVVVAAYVIAGTIEIALRLGVVILLLWLLNIAFAATFSAARAPFKIANLFVTAAAGSASAWHFIRGILK